MTTRRRRFAITAVTTAVMAALGATIAFVVPAALPTAFAASCDKVIALTLDDGPVAGTANTLAILRRKGVRATFFLQGDRVAADPATVRRIRDAGHVVGNHTYSHSDLTGKSVTDAAGEIGRAQAAIAAATGTVPTLARAPFGLTNDAVLALYAAMGLTHVMWNDQALDWEAPAPSVIVDRIMAGARPGGIILLHDEHNNTRAAMPAVIDRLTDAGYCFGKVTSTGVYDPDLRSAVKVVRF